MLIKNVLFHHFFLKFLVDNSWMKNIKSFATVKILTNFEILEYFSHIFIFFVKKTFVLSLEKLSSKN